MKTLSKRLQQARQNIDSNNFYNAETALDLVLKTATARFNESIEAHITLNIDPKYADQQLRTTVVLPHGTGRSVRIGVLVSDDQIQTAQNAGADVFGSDDLIQDISNGILNFDLLIATPDMMPKLSKLGRVLGPKGLMPSLKSGTVSNDLENVITEFKKGKLEYRADKSGIVHISFGKANFSASQLLENLRAFYQSVEKNRPTGVKGQYVKKVTLCSTMGPSVYVDNTTIL